MKKPVVTTIFIGVLLAASAGTTVHRDPRQAAYETRVERLETQLAKVTSRVEVLEKKLRTFNLRPPAPAATQAVPLRIKGAAEKFGPTLTVGQTAYLTQNDAIVKEIIDGQNMLVRLTVQVLSRRTSSGPLESRFLTSAPSRPMPVHKMVWVKGISTTGLVDGSPVKTRVPLIITGTKAYTSWGDKETFFLLEPAKTR